MQIPAKVLAAIAPDCFEQLTAESPAPEAYTLLFDNDLMTVVGVENETHWIAADDLLVKELRWIHEWDSLCRYPALRYEHFSLEKRKEYLRFFLKFPDLVDFAVEYWKDYRYPHERLSPSRMVVV